MRFTHPIHDFKYIGGELCCEGVKVSAIARRVGTPVYIYSYNTLVGHFHKIAEAFKDINPLICFAMKANGNPAILKALANQGAGFDIVSGGELKKVRHIKADMKKVVFASVGKTDREISEAITSGILLFNVESEPELSNINRIAGKLKKKVQVALRINPDIDSPTHEKINTGSLKKKFGIDLSTARGLFLARKAYRNLLINGVHVHIGSQILLGEPFILAIERALAFVDELLLDGVKIDYFDIGGGLGIVYKDETPQTAQQFADKVLPLLRRYSFRVIMEPGRFIAGNAGILLTRKLYMKDNGVRKFMIVDAGMNDLVRPSMYGSYHEILPVRKTSARKVICDVVGPICESGDVFAYDRSLPEVKNGALLALLSAGAYGYAMASNYNARGRAAEVLVHGGRWDVVQEREDFQDLIRGSKVPHYLEKGKK